MPDDEGGIDPNALKAQLPAYMSAAAHAAINVLDIKDFSDGVLDWWRANGESFPAWAEAARVAFAITPNYASCERVFSLLRVMYGEMQASALSDHLQVSLMSRYNKRIVG
mmetsp:Transcript_19461/g.58791  ORF Transcript_19461/g.58791 Transcript_19461/m.58791 type:complete len:110 (-) Transcript_19461:141-470(-)